MLGIKMKMKSIAGKFLKVQTGKEQHEAAAGVDKQTDRQSDGQKIERDTVEGRGRQS